MKKVMNLLAMLLTVPVFTSCDPVYRIVVNNYGKPSTITVKYMRKPSFMDSDSLIVAPINDENLKSKILRQNIDSTHYQFVAPTNCQIQLMPQSLGKPPIKEITFQTDKDSTVVVKLFDSDWRTLQKQGILKRKLFKITVNRK
jgi:hypothetical protein